MSKECWKEYITNKKIIFDQLDASNFTPVLDAARYGCFDTFKYLIKRSNTDYPITGHIDMACSCYQSDIGLVFASLVNTDHRIFNYLINNYDG